MQEHSKSKSPCKVDYFVHSKAYPEMSTCDVFIRFAPNSRPH